MRPRALSQRFAKTKERILVVEDDAPSRAIMAVALAREGRGRRPGRLLLAGRRRFFGLGRALGVGLLRFFARALGGRLLLLGGRALLLLLVTRGLGRLARAARRRPPDEEVGPA